MVATLIILAFASGCHASKENAVVIYTSQDQVYAEPIFRSFTAETGIEVLPVFDTESVKTAGLANRLRFEKSNPQCDVFWNNEEMHTRFLERDGLLQEANPWSAAGYRTRRIVINTNLVSAANAPKNLMELTNAAWRGKIVLAYPLFGTTAYQFLALRQHWGDEIWKAWCKGLVANNAKTVDGNSVVVKLVAGGEAQIGLTDSDDIAAGLEQHFPIEALPVNSETLAIPNTVAIIRKCPHPELAEQFRSFLLKGPSLEVLVAMGAAEGTNFEEIRNKTLKMDWSSPLANFAEASGFLKEVFLR